MKRFIKSALAFTLALGVALTTSTTTIEAGPSVEGLMSEMSLRQKITQLMMPDFRNWKGEGETKETGMTVLHPEVKEIIEEFEFGGVILFAENVKGTEQTARLTYAMQEAATNNDIEDNNKIPLLLGIDQEGGIVYRLGTGTALPGNMAVGATRSTEYAKNVGQIIGRELKSLGINVNFAPSLDVNNNPKNPVIGLRSYSSDPQLVADLGVATIQGLKEYGISGSAKHFPGHGDTAVDSHYGLPEVNKSLDELNKTEFVPFRAAINEGIDMFMTAHIMFPQLDADLPATLSKNILTDLVREDMGYEGVVITDAMNMKGIADHFEEIDAAEKAIEAGVDILLMPFILRSKADITNKVIPMIDAMEAKALADPAFMARIDESVLRVLKLKEKQGVLSYADNKVTLEQQVENSLREVGSEQNRDLERLIARDAVTVVKNDDNVLPFKPTEDQTVLLVGAYANEVPGMEFAVRRLKAEGVIPEGVTIKTQIQGSALTEEQIIASLEGVDYVVIISEVGNETQLNPAKSWVTKAPDAYTKHANEKGIKSVIMSISKPYDVARYDDAQAVMAVYGAKGMDPTEGLRPDAAFGPNIIAGVEIAFGKSASKGKLPVDVPVIADDYTMTEETKYEFGYGLTTKIADYSALEALITKIDGLNPADYSQATWDKLIEVYNLAKTMIANGYATQDEVNALVAQLDEAVEGLEEADEEVITTVKLEETLDKAKAIDLKLYTVESGNRLTTAINEAEALIARINEAGLTRATPVTQREVNEAEANLQSAMDSLVKLSEDTTEEKTEDKEDGKGGVNTGINNPTLLFSITLLGAVLALILLKVRKSKNTL